MNNKTIKTCLAAFGICSLASVANAQVVAGLTINSGSSITINMSGSLVGPTPSGNAGYIVLALDSTSPIGYQNPANSAFSPNRTSISVAGSNPFMSGQLINLDGEETIELYNSLSGLQVGDTFSGSVTINYANPHLIAKNATARVFWGKPGKGTEQVPEPSSTALLGLGAMGILLRRKR